jgi:hypothetical protein
MTLWHVSRRLALVLATTSLVMALPACGGTREDTRMGDAGDEPSPSGGDTPPASSAGGGGGPPPDGGPSAEGCTTPGAKRPAAPAEKAEYCVCEQRSTLRWVCYGPDPNSPRPNPSCPGGSALPDANGSCLVSWLGCSDNRVYQISCIGGKCVCMVQGEVTVLLEPLTACPTSKSDANKLCGWNLQ